MLIYLLLLILLFLILYLLAIMPKMRNKPTFENFEGRYYAHRGLHQDKNIAPENSLKAFKLAIDNDYGIELDVQLSKDNQPVIFHDANLKRVCGLDRLVNELTFNELRDLRLYNSDEKIPHLREALDLIDGKIPLIVEFKLESFDTLICEIVAPYLDKYTGIYCVESFHPAMVNWYKKHRPHIIRGQLAANNLLQSKKGIENRMLNFVLKNLLFNFWGKPDFIAYEHKYGGNLSLLLCRNFYGVPTVAYTVKSQKQLNKSKKFFDLIIFDSFIPESITNK